MKAYILGSTITALALLQGCTSLDAVLVEDGVMPSQGAPYNLTFTEYDFTVNRRLIACFEESGTPPKKVPSMVVMTTVELKRNEARDLAREYVIDFAALRSFFKTTDVAVEYYENGSLKSVNATATDKTGEFLKNAFTAAAKVVSLGTGVGAGVGPPPDACLPTVQETVTAAKETEERLVAKTAALSLQTEQLEKLLAVAMALGQTRDQAERREFADRVNALFVAKADVDKEQKALVALLKSLTITSTKKWPKNGSEFSGLIVRPLTLDDTKRWGGLSDKAMDRLSAETGVWAIISSDSPSAKHVVCAGKPCDKKTSVEELRGLKYRVAMPGLLRVCSNKRCTGDKAELLKDVGLFSQLGPVMTLPLNNYPFMSQTVVLTLNQAGQPTKLGYKSEAAAANAVDAFSVFVDEYGKVRQTNKPKSELDLVKEETALLEAKAKLAAAKIALEPKANADESTATEALKADTALLEAELAKIKAQTALDGVRQQAAP